MRKIVLLILSLCVLFSTACATSRMFTITITAPNVTAPDNGVVTVSVNASNGKPSGMVDLLMDGKLLASQPIHAEGTRNKTVFTVPRPRVGSHTLSATFTPNGAAAPVTQDGELVVSRVGQFRALKYPTAFAPMRVMALAATTPAPTMTFKRRQHTATLLNDGRVLIVGGRSQVGTLGDPTMSTAEIFDPTTETFTPTSSLNVMRAGHTSVLLNDGRVAIFGGYGNINTNVPVEFFNPQNETFTTGNAVQALGGWRGMSAFTFSDNVVLLQGGLTLISSTQKQLHPTMLYDVATDSLTEVLSCPKLVGAASIQLSDGRVVITGGSSDYPDENSSDRIFVYTPSTRGCVELSQRLNEGRVNHGIRVDAETGIVYVYGGLKTDRTVNPPVAVALKSVEAINVDTGEVTVVTTPDALPLMPDTRANFISAGLQDNTSLIVGGVAAATTEIPQNSVPLSGNDPSASDRQIVVDEMSRDAGYTPNVMVTSRVGYTSTPTLDGRVVIVGGDAAEATAGTGEVYEPNSGFYIKLPQPMATAGSTVLFSVVDNNGNPITDATVTAGTGGTITNNGGQYSLQVGVNAQGFVDITATNGIKTATTRLRIVQQ